MPSTEPKRIIVAILGTLLVLVLCLLPRAWLGRENNAHLIPHFDKLVHFGMFFVFAFLWARVVEPGETFRARLLMIGAAVISLAISTEWAQGFSFINRDPDVLDALADTAGGFTGLLLESSLRIFRHQRSSLQATQR